MYKFYVCYWFRYKQIYGKRHSDSPDTLKHGDHDERLVTPRRLVFFISGVCNEIIVIDTCTLIIIDMFQQSFAQDPINQDAFYMGVVSLSM